MTLMNSLSLQFTTILLLLSTLVIGCSSGSGTSDSTAGTATGSTSGESTSNGTTTADGSTTESTTGNTTEGNTNNGNTTSGDTTSGDSTTGSNVDTVSADYPTQASDGSIVWSYAPIAGDLLIEVSAFTQLPVAQSGKAARINDMFSGGGKLFVSTEQDGYIYDITDGNANLWFDVAQAVQSTQGRMLDTQNLFHGGLRSVAFHPDFSNNGKFYTSLMEQRPANAASHTYLSNLETDLTADSVVIEWTANAQTMEVDATSYREVFRVGVPEYDHPIKQIEFNPHATTASSDYGLLYIGHGDGSILSQTARGGQRNDALGKVLRINPLASGDQPYTVPSDNPFVGNNAMIDEVYSIGHRNPHHLSFAPNGTLIVADAGRDNIDEINVVVAGANYGWSDREGHYRQLADGSLFDGISPLPADDASNGYTYPAAAYGHNGIAGKILTNEAIVGGPVLSAPSGDEQYYFYNEFTASGDILYSTVSALNEAVTQGSADAMTVAQTYKASIAFDHDNNVQTEGLQKVSMIDVLKDAATYDNSNRADTRLGSDSSGNLYVMNKRNGIVYKATLIQN